jgi:ParB family chromosome partitioning protein
MAKSRKGLGKGLDALLKMNVQDDTDLPVQGSSALVSTEKPVIAGFTELNIQDIKTNPDQPRKQFDEAALAELATSIKNYGLIQPITVTKVGTKYEIIAGERRYRAVKMLGLKSVPVIIKDIAQKERLATSLIENIQRESLNPVEEALAYNNLIETYDITQEELGERLGKSRTAVTNTIRLLQLDAEIQHLLMDGTITAGHARAILSIQDVKQHGTFTRHIVSDKLTVRESEQLARKWPLKAKKSAPVTQKKKELELVKAEERIQQQIQTKVKIVGSSKKGKIQIEYFTQEELERLIEYFEV